jgi:serine/threonine protein kinase
MKPKLDDFVILKVIGRGVMGKVLLVRHKQTRKLYALKSIHKEWVLSHGQVQHAKSERAILTAFSDSIFHVDESEENSGFLIKLYASFQTSTELFYVMNFMVGGDLASILAKEGRLGEGRVKFLAAEIAVGLHLLHSKGVVYRDLKPENVLLDSRGHVVLTDFGLSKILAANPKTKTFCGTAEYLAPEILKGVEYDQSVDWWSFGTMLYEMVTGITPYWSENAAFMYRKILYEPNLDFPPFMTPEACDIIRKVQVKG